jgi:hypothetical protein
MHWSDRQPNPSHSGPARLTRQPGAPFAAQAGLGEVAPFRGARRQSSVQPAALHERRSGRLAGGSQYTEICSRAAAWRIF